MGYPARKMIFQSTLPRGERLILSFPFRQVFHFNPRSHGGSDGNHKKQLSNTHISIHAPTGGATVRCLCCLKKGKVFQSTLPRGERPRAVVQTGKGHAFQSTLPRGERLKVFVKAMTERNFNPRSHGGSDDPARYSWTRVKGISIHAPTGGATWPEWKYSARWRNFNPRSHGGSDEFCP